MIPYSLNTELIEISQKLENRKLLSEKLQKAKSIFKAESSALETLQHQMHREHQDVKELENTTLKSIWYDLLNKKFSELEREQEEYFQAKMQFEVQKNMVDNLAFEIKTLEAQVVDFQTLKIRYESIIQEKIKFLSENNHPKIAEVFQEQDKLVSLNGNIKEVEEALAVVENVLTVLPRVINDLKSAKSYATWDAIGGGAGATFMKRRKMQEANLGIIEINYVLDRLKRELKDVNPALLPANVNFDTSWEFADYFFDNIFVDLKIKNRIEEAYYAILSLFDTIMVLKENLIIEKTKQQDMYDAKDKELKQMIELV